jgi:CubicO group peptidase (beta-lactamase class C family)
MAEGLSADGLARFGAVAAAHVGDEKVPGLVALVARGDQVHLEALGSLSIGGAQVRRDSLFRIASMSKPVTGAATLALVDEGLLNLEEPVDRLLPELANRRVLRRMDGPLDEVSVVARSLMPGCPPTTNGVISTARWPASPSGQEDVACRSTK